MNIGRCRRAFSARSTAPRPMIGSELAVQETTMSNSGRRDGRSASGNACAPRRAASSSPRSQRAVGDRHQASAGAPRNASRRARSSRRRRRTARSACRRSSNSCEARRTAAAAMLIECAPISVDERTSLATANERWNICCSVVPSVPALLGLAHRLLQLAQDLRLAEHHRVEAAGDAKRVARGRGSPARSCVEQQRAGDAALSASQSATGCTSDGRARARRRTARCGCRSTASPPRARRRRCRRRRAARTRPRAPSTPATTARAETRSARAGRWARSGG